MAKQHITILELSVTSTVSVSTIGAARCGRSITKNSARRIAAALGGKIIFVNTGHSWLVNLDSLARYFEAGDPGPAGQDETVGGIRRVER